jgi:uncharacterized membrane protein YvlD (DUF360 family)
MERIVLRTMLTAPSVLAGGTIIPQWIVVSSTQSILILCSSWASLTLPSGPILAILSHAFQLTNPGLFTIVINVRMFWPPTPLPTGGQTEGFTGAIIGSPLPWLAKLTVIWHGSGHD